MPILLWGRSDRKCVPLQFKFNFYVHCFDRRWIFLQKKKKALPIVPFASHISFHSFSHYALCRVHHRDAACKAITSNHISTEEERKRIKYRCKYIGIHIKFSVVFFSFSLLMLFFFFFILYNICSLGSLVVVFVLPFAQFLHWKHRQQRWQRNNNNNIQMRNFSVWLRMRQHKCIQTHMKSPFRKLVFSFTYIRTHSHTHSHTNAHWSTFFSSMWYPQLSSRSHWQDFVDGFPFMVYCKCVGALFMFFLLHWQKHEEKKRNENQTLLQSSKNSTQWQWLRACIPFFQCLEILRKRKNEQYN